MSRVERSDDSIINGEWHYCEDCKTRWSDSDGGCECVMCDTCDKPFDPDNDAGHITTQKHHLLIPSIVQTFYKCGDCVMQQAFNDAEEAGI